MLGLSFDSGPNPSGAALPVTAKLSRRFYDQLGDDVANELVNWFNAVDETYRHQLREINELNWERFRSELRAEGVAIRSDVDRRLAETEKRLDARFAVIDTLFTRIDARFDSIDAEFDARFDSSEAKFNARFDSSEAKFDARLNTTDAKFDAKFARIETRMYKVMFGFWTATIVPLAVLMLALNGVFQR